jgi:hypothetical protein
MSKQEFVIPLLLVGAVGVYTAIAQDAVTPVKRPSLREQLIAILADQPDELEFMKRVDPIFREQFHVPLVRFNKMPNAIEAGNGLYFDYDPGNVYRMHDSRGRTGEVLLTPSVVVAHDDGTYDVIPLPDKVRGDQYLLFLDEGVAWVSGERKLMLWHETPKPSP